VFPDAEDTPSRCFKEDVVAGVTRPVRGELRVPVPAVRARSCAVVGTAMPITPVEEHGDLLSREDNVRSRRRSTGTDPHAESESQASPMELGAKGTLRPRLPTVSSHHCAHGRATGARRNRCQAATFRHAHQGIRVNLMSMLAVCSSASWRSRRRRRPRARPADVDLHARQRLRRDAERAPLCWKPRSRPPRYGTSSPNCAHTTSSDAKHAARGISSRIREDPDTDS
jgi:hypothetical protein